MILQLNLYCVSSPADMIDYNRCFLTVLAGKHLIMIDYKEALKIQLGKIIDESCAKMSTSKNTYSNNHFLWWYVKSSYKTTERRWASVDGNTIQ